MMTGRTVERAAARALDVFIYASDGILSVYGHLDVKCRVSGSITKIVVDLATTAFVRGHDYRHAMGFGRNAILDILDTHVVTSTGAQGIGRCDSSRLRGQLSRLNVEKTSLRRESLERRLGRML